MRDYNDMWDRKNRLQRRCEALEKSVEELEVMEKDYGRIREFFGVDKVDSLILEIKEKERLECEKEKERRKLMRRNQRDTR